MPAIVEIKLTQNGSQIEAEFCAHQAGHLTPLEDQEIARLRHFFRVYFGARQARANAENPKVSAIDEAALAEIARKVIKDKRFDEDKGLLEVDITDDVKEFDAALDTDMREVGQ